MLYKREERVGSTDRYERMKLGATEDEVSEVDVVYSRGLSV